MDSAELKGDLYRLIGETDDVEILSMIKEYFKQLHINKNADWWNDIPNSQQNSIKTGIEELNSGKKVNHSDVRKKVKKLLNINE
jgi:predicted transcriptional regulator